MSSLVKGRRLHQSERSPGENIMSDNRSRAAFHIKAGGVGRYWDIHSLLLQAIVEAVKETAG